MPSESLHELLGRHLEGRLDERQRADLARTLRDPEGLELFLRGCSIHLALLDWSAMERSGRAAGPPAQRPAGPTPRRLAPARRAAPPAAALGPWGWAAAACLLAALGLYLLKDRTGTPPRAGQTPPQQRPVGHEPEVAAVAEIAVLEQAGTGVTLLRGGKFLPCASGTRLHPLDELQASSGAGAGIRYPDGTRVDLESGSRMLLEEQAGAKRVRLLGGALAAAVAPQPQGKAMCLLTPHAESVVVGTRLRLSIEGSATRLEVSEGKVRFAKAAALLQGGPAESLELRAGESSWARAGSPLQVQQSSPPGGGEEWVLAGGWGRFLTMGEELPGPNPRVRSQRVTGPLTDPWFQPDEVLMLQDPKLVTIPEQMEVILLIRSEKPGRIQVTLAPERPRIPDENNGSKRIPIGPESHRIVLRGADFSPLDGGRALYPGMRIVAFGIWGFKAGRLTLEQVTVRRGSEAK